MHRRRTVLLTLLLLASVVAVPVVLTWRQVKQERLDQALFVAVKHNDTREAISLLQQGADANARAKTTPSMPFWRVLLNRLHGFPPRPDTGPDALFVALELPEGTSGWPPDNPTLVKVLLDHGALVNIRD